MRQRKGKVAILRIMVHDGWRVQWSYQMRTETLVESSSTTGRLFQGAISRCLRRDDLHPWESGSLWVLPKHSQLNELYESLPLHNSHRVVYNSGVSILPDKRPLWWRPYQRPLKQLVWYQSSSTARRFVSWSHIRVGEERFNYIKCSSFHQFPLI